MWVGIFALLIVLNITSGFGLFGAGKMCWIICMRYLDFVLDDRVWGSCGYPGVPAGGVLVDGGQDSRLGGTEVMYECKKEHVMIGEQTRKCEKNGT